MVNLPNKITLTRIAAIPIFIVLLVQGKDQLAAIAFLIISATDMIDGYIARKRKMTSKAGAILDPLADKLLVCAALVFLIKRGVEPWMVYVIIAREFLVTGLRLLVQKKDITTASWLGKLKTISQMTAILIVLLDAPYGYHAMLVATILTVLSGVDYFLRARKNIQL